MAQKNVLFNQENSRLHTGVVALATIRKLCSQSGLFPFSKFDLMARCQEIVSIDESSLKEMLILGNTTNVIIQEVSVNTQKASICMSLQLEWVHFLDRVVVSKTYYSYVLWFVEVTQKVFAVNCLSTHAELFSSTFCFSVRIEPNPWKSQRTNHDYYVDVPHTI